MKGFIQFFIDIFIHQSVVAAVNGGADRIELCSALELGGLTPSVALLKMIKRDYPNLPVFCLIRCRTGGFIYTSDELQLMKDEIKILDKAGADGFVIGCLTENSSSGSIVVSGEATEILTSASKKPFTFHRAFDVSTGCFSQEIELIAKSGCDYVLTSGRASIARNHLRAFGKGLSLKTLHFSPSFCLFSFSRIYLKS